MVGIGEPRHKQDGKADAPQQIGIEPGKGDGCGKSEQDGAHRDAEGAERDPAEKEGFPLIDKAFSFLLEPTGLAARGLDADAVLFGARLQVSEIDPVQ